MAWLVCVRPFLLCLPLLCFSCAGQIQTRPDSDHGRTVGLSNTVRDPHTHWDRARRATSAKYAAGLDSYQGSHSDDNGAEAKWEEDVGGSFSCATVEPWKDWPFDDSPCRRKTKVGKLVKIWSPCGTGDTEFEANFSSCFCYQDYASCCGTLTVIPRFNSTVLFLDFNSSDLYTLSDVTFQNVPDLKWLFLNTSNISVVTSDAFKNVGSLECLEFTRNNAETFINATNFTSAVNQLPKLKLLALNYTQFSRDGEEDAGITYVMKHLKSDTLEVLFADGGNKTVLYLSDVVKLPRLRTLSVASHSILNMHMCSEDSLRTDQQDQDAAYAYPVSKDPWADVGRRWPKGLLLPGDDNGLSTTGQDANVSASNWYTYNNDPLPAGVGPASATEPESEASSCSTFSLPRLTVLDMSYNLLVAFPNFCRENAMSDGAAAVLPNLTHLSFSLNPIVNPEQKQMTCLPSVTSMSLTGAPLRRIKSRVFQGLPKLHDLDLRFTNVMFIELEAFNHSSLQVINIQSSNWFFDIQHASNFDPQLFHGSTLTQLDLSYNVFRFVSAERLRQMLEPLKSLRRLYMAGIGLFVIPEIITSSFLDLEVFWFNDNLVSYVAPNTFENLTRLMYLDLRDNRLTSPDVRVLQNLRKGKGRNVTVKVNLAWNPYSCTCDMLPFLQMMRQYRSYSYTPEELSSSASGGSDGDAQLQIVGAEYRCYSPDNVYNMSLTDLEMTVQMCILTEQQAIIIHCVCIVVILIICIYSFLYRYRWQVRFWMYSLHVRWNRRWEGQRGHRTRYKAFVSYCPGDSHFVLTKVLPSLETRYGLPLCIHERDFVPGRYISQNIVERMEESSHVLLVLSNAFLEDDWCKFELFVAQRYALIHRQIPVTVLLLEPLRVELMDAHVIIMLQSRPGLEWPGQESDARERDTFWRRLGESLTSAEGRPPTSPRNGRVVLARR